MQASYDAVYAAAANLEAAQRAYLDARYANYRVRLVSPHAAYTEAVADLRALNQQGLDHVQHAFCYEHAKEIRS